MGGRRVTSEKKRLERVLNEIFGVEVAWSRLSIEDLKVLTHVLTNEDAKRGLCRRLKCQADIAGLIDTIIPEEHQGPILKGLKALLGGKAEKRGGEG